MIDISDFEDDLARNSALTKEGASVRTNTSGSERSLGNDESELLANIYELKITCCDWIPVLRCDRGRLLVVRANEHTGVLPGDILCAVDEVQLENPKAQKPSRIRLPRDINLRFLRIPEGIDPRASLADLADVCRQVQEQGNARSNRPLRQWQYLDPIIRVCWMRMDHCERRGRYDIAIHCALRALLFLRVRWSDSHFDICKALCTIGDLYTKQGDIPRAIHFFRESLWSLSMHSSKLGIPTGHKIGENDPLRATEADQAQVHAKIVIMEKLATLLKRMSHFDKAHAMLIALGKLWKTLPRTGERVRGEANILHLLASIYRSRAMNNGTDGSTEGVQEANATTERERRLLLAEQTGKACMSLRLKWLGPLHLDVAQSFNFLASVQLERGDYSAVVEGLFHRALDIVTKRCGEASSNAASCLRNLSGLHYLRKNYEKAETFKLREVRVCLLLAKTAYVSQLAPALRGHAKLLLLLHHGEAASRVRRRAERYEATHRLGSRSGRGAHDADNGLRAYLSDTNSSQSLTRSASGSGSGGSGSHETYSYSSSVITSSHATLETEQSHNDDNTKTATPSPSRPKSVFDLERATAVPVIIQMSGYCPHRRSQPGIQSPSDALADHCNMSI
jgi:tetratricopeptide (TPR) repeat protein